MAAGAAVHLRQFLAHLENVSTARAAQSTSCCSRRTCRLLILHKVKRWVQRLADPYRDLDVIDSRALRFLYEVGFAIWLVRTVSTTPLAVGLLALQFLGGLVAMFSQLQLISLLGVGILAFQVSFGVMLVAATARFPAAVADEPRTEGIPVL